uniref:Lipid droplet-associated protein n=1 Tax=Sminthopsis macroura TaxID=9302 RepID=D5I2V1_SMIMA|nr:lipid droplet-associated protein [Sminthopsis macroura]
MELHVDQTSDTGEIIKSSEIKETVSDILNNAKLILSELNSKSSSESNKEERMSRPQVAEPPEKPEEILDKAQQSIETNSLTNTNSSSSSEEDATNNDVTPKSMSEEEKFFSEIQEEKQSLEELKVSMDKYLPASVDVDDIQESSTEDKDYFREDSKKDESYFVSLGSLPTRIQPQVYKNAMEIIRDAKNNIRKLLGQLYEAIELTYQSKQGSDDQKNYYKALFDLWIKWSRSLSEEDDKIQLLEIRTLGMSRSIALKLQSAFMDLMPKVQGLPNGLQDKMKRACYDIQELHTTFSLSNKFEDLDKYHLTQSQLKLTQAQGSIEELFFFLENDMSGSIGPLSPY